jgi:glutamate dehydrogenase/leucine dehydrogenase
MSDLTIVDDEMGPEKVVHIFNRSAGLKAIVVIDNCAAGPAVGGVRMAPDVSLSECARLARAMTLKNAAAGLPHGGGKSVIAADPAMPAQEKERLVRAFAQSIRTLPEYIPGPDMGTDETCMAWVRDEISRAVGLPRVLGGIPLDEIGATGIGVAFAAEEMERFCDVRVKGSRVAVQGFGAVGTHAARALAARGARIVAVSDSKGCVMDGNGLDLEALLTLKAGGRPVTDLPDARTEHRDAVISADCDILIPAARPDVIDDGNMDQVRAALIIEGANIPITEAAEEALHKRGVAVVPDFIANAGGVICASVEYHGGTESQALAAIEEKIRKNTRAVFEAAQARAAVPRRAALDIAGARVAQAMSFRRF